jgi:DNA topoisomerase-1
LGAAQKFIEKKYGQKYSQYRTYATKSKLAQEAHEAIRPTNINVDSLTTGGKDIRHEHVKLYDLIWRRAVASQMAAAIFDSTTINITSANSYTFETKGSIIKFEGYLKVAGYDAESVVLPDVAVGDELKIDEIRPEQKYTLPPPRYNEASLIKSLEENGIGRPSTYAPTISTIFERQYISKEVKEDGRLGRNFNPTELGYLVNDFLVKYFPGIVDLPFTATMEQHLDDIAQGKREWIPVIDEFYSPFAKQLVHVEETVEKTAAPIEKTGEQCPECKQGDVLVKQGKFGKFYACSRFPDCKYTKNMLEKIDMKCPDCKDGDVVVRKTRRGRIFYGCSRYPDCKFASWTKPNLPNSKNPQ